MKTDKPISSHPTLASWAVKLQEREYHAVLTAAVLAVAAVFGYTPEEATTGTIIGTFAVFVAFIINRAMIKKEEVAKEARLEADSAWYERNKLEDISGH